MGGGRSESKVASPKSKPATPAPVVKRKYKQRIPKDLVTPKPVPAAPKITLADIQAAKPASGDAPATFGAAMKLEIVRIKQPFTADELRQVLAANHAALVADVGDNALGANLAYWAAKARLQKVGMGNQAAYRVLEPEFFQTPQN